MKTLKSQKQEAFWKSMVNKYEDRNIKLEEQQCQLQQRLEALECSVNKREGFELQLGDYSGITDCPCYLETPTPLVPPPKQLSYESIFSCPCDPCPNEQHVQLPSTDCPCNPCMATATAPGQPKIFKQLSKDFHFDCPCDACTGLRPGPPQPLPIGLNLDSCPCGPCVANQTQRGSIEPPSTSYSSKPCDELPSSKPTSTRTSRQGRSSQANAGTAPANSCLCDPCIANKVQQHNVSSSLNYASNPCDGECISRRNNTRGSVRSQTLQSGPGTASAGSGLYDPSVVEEVQQLSLRSSKSKSPRGSVRSQSPQPSLDAASPSSGLYDPSVVEEVQQLSIRSSKSRSRRGSVQSQTAQPSLDAASPSSDVYNPPITHNIEQQSVRSDLTSDICSCDRRDGALTPKSNNISGSVRSRTLQSSTGKQSASGVYDPYITEDVQQQSITSSKVHSPPGSIRSPPQIITGTTSASTGIYDLSINDKSQRQSIRSGLTSDSCACGPSNSEFTLKSNSTRSSVRSCTPQSGTGKQSGSIGVYNPCITDEIKQKSIRSELTSGSCSCNPCDGQLSVKSNSLRGSVQKRSPQASAGANSTPSDSHLANETRLQSLRSGLSSTSCLCDPCDGQLTLKSNSTRGSVRSRTPQPTTGTASANSCPCDSCTTIEVPQKSLRSGFNCTCCSCDPCDGQLTCKSNSARGSFRSRTLQLSEAANSLSSCPCDLCSNREDQQLTSKSNSTGASVRSSTPQPSASTASVNSCPCDLCIGRSTSKPNSTRGSVRSRTPQPSAGTASANSCSCDICVIDETQQQSVVPGSNFPSSPCAYINQFASKSQNARGSVQSRTPQQSTSASVGADSYSIITCPCDPGETSTIGSKNTRTTQPTASADSYSIITCPCDPGETSTVGSRSTNATQPSARAGSNPMTSSSCDPVEFGSMESCPCDPCDTGTVESKITHASQPSAHSETVDSCLCDPCDVGKVGNGSTHTTQPSADMYSMISCPCDPGETSTVGSRSTNATQPSARAGSNPMISSSCDPVEFGSMESCPCDPCDTDTVESKSTPASQPSAHSETVGSCPCDSCDTSTVGSRSTHTTQPSADRCSMISGTGETNTIGSRTTGTTQLSVDAGMGSMVGCDSSIIGSGTYASQPSARSGTIGTCTCNPCDASTITSNTYASHPSVHSGTIRSCPCNPCDTGIGGGTYASQHSARSETMGTCTCHPCNTSTIGSGSYAPQPSSLSRPISCCPCNPCGTGGVTAGIYAPQPILRSGAIYCCSCNPCDAGRVADGTYAPQPILRSGAICCCHCNPCGTGRIGDNTDAAQPSSRSGTNGSCGCCPCATNTTGSRPGQRTQAGLGPSCPCNPCNGTPIGGDAYALQPKAETPVMMGGYPYNPGMTDNTVEVPVSPTKFLLDNRCLAQQVPVGAGKISLPSIRSADIQNVNKLQELATKEKQMRGKIEEMQQREQSYVETLKQADEMWANMEGCYRKRLSDVQQTGDTSRLQYERASEQLMEENQRLSDELKDIKLELKQCMEKVKGPLTRQLEKERRKSEQLESDLVYTSKVIANKESSYMSEMNDLQGQLHCTCKNLSDLKSTNEQLQREMCTMQCKYNQLQKDLVNQKISEAHTLERMNEALCMKQEIGVFNDRLPEVPKVAAKLVRTKQEDDTLYAIARRLSKTLVAVEECQACKQLPSDLTDTVKGIKDIVDIVDQEKPHKTSKRESAKVEEPERGPTTRERGTSLCKPLVDRSTETIIRSTLNVGTSGEGVVDVQTETETTSVRHESTKVPSLKSAGTGDGRISREPSVTTSTTPSRHSSASRRSSKKSSVAGLKTLSRTSGSRASIQEPEKTFELNLTKSGDERFGREPSVTTSTTPSRHSSASRHSSKKSSGTSFKTSSRTRSSSASTQEAEKAFGLKSTGTADGTICPEPIVIHSTTPSRHSSTSRHSSKKSSVTSLKTSTRTRSSSVSIQEPEKTFELFNDSIKKEFVKPQGLIELQPEIEITTTIDGDIKVEIENEVDTYESISDGVNVTTTITSSGTLEVITEGPAGIIETTMTMTDSGNIEVTTEITEYPADYQPLGLALPTVAIEEIEDGYSKSDISVTSASRITKSASKGSRSLGSGSSTSRPLASRSLVSRSSSSRSSASPKTVESSLFSAKRSTVSDIAPETDKKTKEEICRELCAKMFKESSTMKMSKSRETSVLPAEGEGDLEVCAEELIKHATEEEAESTASSEESTEKTMEEETDGAASESAASQDEESLNVCAKEVIAIASEEAEGSAGAGKATEDDICFAVCAENSKPVAEEVTNATSNEATSEANAPEKRICRAAYNGVCPKSKQKTSEEVVDTSKEEVGKDETLLDVGTEEIKEAEADKTVVEEAETATEKVSVEAAIADVVSEFAAVEAEATGDVTPETAVTTELAPVVDEIVAVDATSAAKSFDDEPLAAQEIKSELDKTALEEAAVAIDETTAAEAETATEEVSVKETATGDGVVVEKAVEVAATETATIETVAAETVTTEVDLPIEAAPEAVPIKVATKEGWGALFGDIKPDMPHVKRPDKCKDVCSPTYDKANEEICQDMCATTFKERAAAAVIAAAATKEESVDKTVIQQHPISGTSAPLAELDKEPVSVASNALDVKSVDRSTVLAEDATALETLTLEVDIEATAEEADVLEVEIEVEVDETTAAKSAESGKAVVEETAVGSDETAVAEVDTATEEVPGSKAAAGDDVVAEFAATETGTPETTTAETVTTETYRVPDEAAAAEDALVETTVDASGVEADTTVAIAEAAPVTETTSEVYVEAKTPSEAQVASTEELFVETPPALTTALSQEDSEPITLTGDDTHDIRKGVENALSKANKEVMDALEQANRNVTQALEKANKDVENALALAVKENQIKASKQAATEDAEEVLEHPSAFESIPQGSEAKIVPLVVSDTRQVIETPSDGISTGDSSLSLPKEAEAVPIEASAETAPIEDAAEGAPIEAAEKAVATEVTTKEGWGALFGDIKPDIPHVTSVDKCKAVCSSTYDKANEEICQKMCAEVFKEKAAAAVAAGGSAPSEAATTEAVSIAPTKSVVTKSVSSAPSIVSVPSDGLDVESIDSTTCVESATESLISAPSEALNVEPVASVPTAQLTAQPTTEALPASESTIQTLTSKELRRESSKESPTPGVKESRTLSSTKGSPTGSITKSPSVTTGASITASKTKSAKGNESQASLNKISPKISEVGEAKVASRKSSIASSRKSKIDDSLRKTSLSASKIPVSIQRTSKLAQSKCDCGRCDCEFCLPEIMKQRDEERKAALIAQGKPEDCTCMPGCTCKLCTQITASVKEAPEEHIKKTSKLSPSIEKVKSISKSSKLSLQKISAGSAKSTTESLVKSRKFSRLSVERVKPSKELSAGALEEMECCDPTPEHPPDCDCTDCLCKPCAALPKDYRSKEHFPAALVKQMPKENIKRTSRLSLTPVSIEKRKSIGKASKQSLDKISAEQAKSTTESLAKSLRKSSRFSMEQVEPGEISRKVSHEVSKKPSLSGKPSNELPRKVSREPSQKLLHEILHEAPEAIRIPSGEISREPSRELSGKPSHEVSGKPSRKFSQKATHELSHEPSGETLRKSSDKAMRKSSGELSRIPSRQHSGEPSGKLPRKVSRKPSQKLSHDILSETSAAMPKPSREVLREPSGELLRKASREPSREIIRKSSVVCTCTPLPEVSKEPSPKLSGKPSSELSRKKLLEPSRELLRKSSSAAMRKPSGEVLSKPSLQLSGDQTSKPPRKVSGEPLQKLSHEILRESSAVLRKSSRDVSREPSREPSGRPSGELSRKASRESTHKPSREILRQLSGEAMRKPSREVSGEPSRELARKVSREPPHELLHEVTELPQEPSRELSQQLSQELSRKVSRQLSRQPSREGSRELREPSREPIREPFRQPSQEPSREPIREEVGKQWSHKEIGELTGKPSRELSLKEALKESREASARKILGNQQKIVDHPPGCNCLVCRCCSSIAKSSEKLKVDKPKLPAKKFPPAECTSEECFCLSKQPTPRLEPLLEEESLDDLGKGSGEQDEILRMDDRALESRIAKMEKESLQRKKEMQELQDGIKQIQCSCYEAEARVSATPQQTTCNAKDSSIHDTVSGLHVALSTMRNKCKQKDRMIAAMVDELKLRGNSKVFNDVLQRLAETDSTEGKTAFDRTAMGPISGSTQERPSNQLRTPLKTCHHSNFPNCSCKIRHSSTVADEQKRKTCVHPNFPNCPCADEYQMSFKADETISVDETSSLGSAAGDYPYYAECAEDAEEARSKLRISLLRQQASNCPSKQLSPRGSTPSPKRGVLCSRYDTPIARSDTLGAKSGTPSLKRSTPSLRYNRGSERTGIPNLKSSPPNAHSCICAKLDAPSSRPSTSTSKFDTPSLRPSTPNAHFCICDPDKSLKATTPRVDALKLTTPRPRMPRARSATPNLQPSTSSIKSSTSEKFATPSKPSGPALQAPTSRPQTSTPCPVSDGTCPCPKIPVLKKPYPQPHKTCPCVRVDSSPKVLETSKRELKPATDEDSTSDQVSSSMSDNTTSSPSDRTSSTPSGHKSSSRSGHKSSSRSDHKNSSRSDHKSSSHSGHRSSSRSDRDSTSRSDRTSSSRTHHKSSSRSDHRSSSKSSHRQSSGSDRQRSNSKHSHSSDSKHRSCHTPDRKSSRTSCQKDWAKLNKDSSSTSNQAGSSRCRVKCADKRSQGKSSPTISQAPIEVTSKRPASAEEKRTVTTDAPISRPARLRRLSTTPRHSCTGVCECDRNTELSGVESPQAPIGEVISSAPMQILEIRRLSPDSLMVKWSSPASKYVTGYEILVDGIIKSRVHSSRRTSAILHMVTSKASLHISIYAITSAGRCEPPVNAVFQV